MVLCRSEKHGRSSKVALLEMRRVSRFSVILIVALATLWSMPPGMRAQSGNQAALVVRHGQDDVRTACIDFDEPQISGYELLQRSGFDLQIGVQGLGSLICSIGDTGCPASDCLCQCKGGGECVYWSYWHRLDDSWQYSQGGASVYRVEPGAVDGWSWGPGAVNQALPPPDISFEEVCQAEATDTPAPSPTATNTQPPIVITPPAAVTHGSTLAATATVPRAAETRSPTVESTATQVVIFTPAPLPRQSEEAATPVENLISPQETAVPAIAMVTEQSSQIAPEGRQEMTDTPVAIPTSTVVDAAAKTPGPVAVVQRAKPGAAETNLGQDAQMLAEPEAEPTAPLTLIGEGVVPTVGAELGEPDIKDQVSRNLVGSDSLPYLAFLIIVAGLGGLLWFVSFRRKQL